MYSYIVRFKIKTLSFHYVFSFYSAVFLTSIGENTPTNIYVDISNLTTNQIALICRTESVNCFSDGRLEGKWFDPSGSQISFDQNSPQGFYSSGSFQELRLIRGVSTPSDGIYTCRLPDSSTQIQVVYVGLYREDGGQFHSCVMDCHILNKSHWLHHLLLQY